MVSRDKAKKILKHWGVASEPVAAVGPVRAGGNSNAFYLGDDFVLKSSRSVEEVQSAISLCTAIQGVGVCSSVIETTDGQSFVQDGDLYFYLARRLPGTRLAAQEFFQGDYAAKARFVGEIIGQLHVALRQVEAPVRNVNLYDSVERWALPIVQDVLPLPEPFCRQYLSTFGRLYDKLPRQIIHRDPNPSNIIASGDQWGFVDFELSEENARILDPCYAAAAILSESFDECDPAKLSRWLVVYYSILRGYDGVVRLTEDERTALPYVMMANQLVCTAWFAEQDTCTEVLETNKRMALWMIRNFSELRIRA